MPPHAKNVVMNLFWVCAKSWCTTTNVWVLFKCLHTPWNSYVNRILTFEWYTLAEMHFSLVWHPFDMFWAHSPHKCDGLENVWYTVLHFALKIRGFQILELILLFDTYCLLSYISYNMQTLILWKKCCRMNVYMRRVLGSYFVSPLTPDFLRLQEQWYTAGGDVLLEETCWGNNIR